MTASGQPGGALRRYPCRLGARSLSLLVLLELSRGEGLPSTVAQNAHKVGGSIVCWGEDPQFSPRGPPHPPLGQNFTTLSVESELGCATLSGGSIKCWSIGSVSDGVPDLLRVLQEGQNFSQVAVGFVFVCGLTIEGFVECTSLNDAAFVQRGTPYGTSHFRDDLLEEFSWLPEDPSEAGPFTAIESAGHNLCALTLTGRVQCFSGYRDTTTALLETQDPPRGEKFVQIAVGYDHACARTSTGKVQCWGNNGFKQTAVPSLSEGTYFVQVEAGYNHSLGLLSNNSIIQWGMKVSHNGYNWSRQAIDGIGAGFYFSAAFLRNGSVVLSEVMHGLGDIRPSAIIVFPTHGTSVIELKLSLATMCALLSNGRVECFEHFSHINYWRPVSGPEDLPPGRTFTHVDSFYRHSCAVLSNGSVQCWGDNTMGQSQPPEPPSGMTFVEVAVGKEHSCGLLFNGSILCFGKGNGKRNIAPDSFEYLHDEYGYGMYGEDEQINPPDPPMDKSFRVPKPALSFKAVAAGSSHTCALVSDGQTVQCWGENSVGETQTQQVGVNETYIAIAAGGAHNCALTRSGRLDCWGLNDEGQTSVPNLPNGQGYIAVSAGGRHTVALLSNGSLVVFGNLFEGNEFTVLYPPPGQIFVALASSYGHSCATTSYGYVECFGDDELGQLDAPDPPAGDFFTAVSTGSGFSCAIACKNSSVPTPTLPKPELAWVPPAMEPTTAMDPTTAMQGGASISGAAIAGVAVGSSILVLNILCCMAVAGFRARRKWRSRMRPMPKGRFQSACKDLESLADSSWIIESQQLQFLRRCGAGSYGTVYLGKLRGAEVAIKCMHGQAGLLRYLDNADEEKAARTITREVLLMTQVHSPYCVQFLGVCLDPLACITEYCARGSLYDLLQQATTEAGLKEQLTWNARLKMALHAALGLQHLHSLDIIHRDLKSPNLMVSESLHVKVGDFGLSVLSPDCHGASPPGCKHADSSMVKQLNRRWMAPETAAALVDQEQHVGQAFTKASDVYAFGLVLLELATFKIPFHDKNDAMVHIQNSQGLLRPVLPKLPKLDIVGGEFLGILQYLELMEACWAEDPIARPSFKRIVDKIRAIMKTLRMATAALGTAPASASVPTAISSGATMDPEASAA